MPILRDTPIALSLKPVVEAQQPHRWRGSRPGPAMLESAGKAIALGRTLYASAAVYAADLQLDVDGSRYTSPPTAPMGHAHYSLAPTPTG